MAKTVAAAGRYPYGICGFLIQGAVLQNGTIIKDARIQKQKNSYDYDIIDSDLKVYKSLRITGLDNNGTELDYSKSDDDLANSLKRGTFYVRAMNENLDYGFAIKFFDNKVILQDGRHLYNLIPPTCSVPKPDLGNIVLDDISTSSTEITGTIIAANPPLNVQNMYATVTINSVQYSAAVNPDGTFSITVPPLSSGTYIVTVSSDFYKNTDAILDIGSTLLSFDISSLQFVQQSDSSYSAVLSGTDHNMTNYIIQTQYNTGAVYNSSLSYNTTSNDITINQVLPTDLKVLLLSSTFVKNTTTTDWVHSGSYYSLTIPSSEYGYTSNVIVQVSELISSSDYEVLQPSIQILSNSDILIQSTKALNARILISAT